MIAELGQVKVLEIDAHHAKGVAGNMLFLVWRYETRLDAFVRARSILSELIEAHPGDVEVMQVIETTALPPNATTRAEFPKLLKLGSGHLKHYSIVHEGSGFKAAIVRTITSTAYMMSRRNFPYEVFSSLDKAAAWHALGVPAVGRRRAAAAITDAVTTLRKRLAELPSPQ